MGQRDYCAVYGCDNNREKRDRLVWSFLCSHNSWLSYIRKTDGITEIKNEWPRL